MDDPDTASTSKGDVTGTRYYTFAGATVAVRTVTDAEAGRVVNLAFLFGDEQGSTSVMMPAQVGASGAVAPATLADASAATRTAYTPYGALRGDDNAALDRGWLGQVEDRVDGATGTGLTYLNARYYDPATMRFISPDPLMKPGDPKTLDPYRYADNNPVVYTDASGLEPRVSDDGKVAGVGGVYRVPDKYWIPKIVSEAMHGGKAPVYRPSAEAAFDLSIKTMDGWLASDDGKLVSGLMADADTRLNVNLGILCAKTSAKGACGLVGSSVSWKGWVGCLVSIFVCHRNPAAVANAGIVAKTFLENFPGRHAWDMKTELREHYHLPARGDTPDKYFSYGPNSEYGLNYDVYGNFQYGVMMSGWGVRLDAAQAAQLGGGAAGPSNEDDSPAVAIGYECAQANPGKVDADAAWAYLMSPEILGRLDAAGKICGPGTQKGACPVE